MKIGVTGALGFVGKRVIESLSLEEDLYLVSNARTNQNLSTNLSRNLKTVDGDLNDSDVSLSFTNDLDLVIHSAARLPMKENSTKHLEQLFQDNVMASVKLGHAAIRSNVRDFIYISSANVYSKELNRASEIDQVGNYLSHDPYFISKLGAEQALLSLFRDSDTKLTILRIGAPFGEGEPGPQVLSKFIDRAKLGESIKIISNPNLHMNCLSIDDVVAGIKLCLTKNPGGIFNLSSDDDTFTLFEIAQFISRHYNSGAPPLSSQDHLVDQNKDFSWVSIEKAKSKFGFSPKPFEDFMRSYIDYYEMKML